MREPVQIRAEDAADAAAIERMQREVFGPGAYARAAFRVREQAHHDPAASFVAMRGGIMIGSVRLTPITVGEQAGYLLGPLMVDPVLKGQGFGKALLAHSIEAARGAGHAFIVLVGDEPYYGPFGFKRVPPGTVRMPGPVNPARLLVAELRPGGAEGLAGPVRGVRRPG